MANYAIWAREKGATKMYIWESHHKSRRSAERKAKLLRAKFPSVKFKVEEFKRFRRLKRATAQAGPATSFNKLPRLRTIRVKQSKRGDRPHIVGKLRSNRGRHSGQRSIKWGALRDEFGF